MSRTITEYQARVYAYAKGRLGTWFTIQELATETNIPEGSAKGQADRFQERGLFELLRISPAQVYRMTAESAARDTELGRRIEEAIPIFEQRQQGWLQREAARLGTAPPPPVAAHQPPVAASEHHLNGSAPAEVHTPPATKPAALPDPAPLSKPAREKASRASVDASGEKSGRTRSDEIIELLGRPGGASLDELVARFGTQPHTIRAQISVSTRRLGLKASYEGGRYRLS